MAVQRSLLRLFAASPSAPVSLLTPLIYRDRLRIRNPGDAKFALGPHVDGGSIERWEDPNYRAVYSKILEADGRNSMPGRLVRYLSEYARR